MGWMFQLDNLLNAMNATRRSQQRTSLTWRDVAALVGLEYKSLVNLASNSTQRATNTRFIEALCRFFCCEPSDLMVLEPRLERPQADHELIDRVLEQLQSGRTPRASFHVMKLYNEETERQWRVRREQIRARGDTQETASPHDREEQSETPRAKRRRPRFRRR